MEQKMWNVDANAGLSERKLKHFYKASHTLLQKLWLSDLFSPSQTAMFTVSNSVSLNIPICTHKGKLTFRKTT